MRERRGRKKEKERGAGKEHFCEIIIGMTIAQKSKETRVEMKERNWFNLCSVYPAKCVTFKL